MNFSRHSMLNAARVGLPVLAVTLLTAAPAVAVIPAPVAHYTFDQGILDYTVDTAIDSANGNTGVWQNANTDGLSYEAGQIGGAVKMRGDTDDYFLISEIPQIDGITPTPLSGSPVLGVGMTLSAWIYIETGTPSASKGILVSRDVSDDTGGLEPDTGQNWGMSWEGGDHIDNRISGNGGGTDSDADSILQGQWHHVAMVWGNVNDQVANIPPSHIVYVDGVKQTEFIEDTSVFGIVDSGSWLIGEDSCCGGREWDGLLDDVAVFGAALSDADVAQLHSNGLAGIDAAGAATGTYIPGDVNLDTFVTIDDFNVLRDNMGLPANSWTDGDLNGNAVVDLNDFRLWLSTASPSLAAEALASFSSTAPEPCGVVLAVAASLFFSGRRRNAHRA